MQLSKRLNAVASMVTTGNRVADIGCDHAYTSIFLAENGISQTILAMDVNQGPIDRAKENIEKYGYADQIITRKSNGLEKLELGEVDTILIAGMGGALMNQILSAKQEVVSSVRELILQPQSEIYKVRRYLQEIDFLIIEENMLMEDGKYYVMMKAVPQSVCKEIQSYRLAQEEHYHYGKLLLEHKNQVLKEFLQWDLSLCQNIWNTLQAEPTEKALLRQTEMNEKIKLIHKALQYYEWEERISR